MLCTLLFMLFVETPNKGMDELIVFVSSDSSGVICFPPVCLYNYILISTKLLWLICKSLCNYSN